MKRIGKVYHGYVIKEIMGKGAMGKVYRAENQQGRNVAIKFLNRKASNNIRNRFEREKSILTSLDHPNIVRVYSIDRQGEDEDFIIMELLKGETLYERLNRGILREEEAATLGVAIARALGFAWEKFAMVHRDINPSNIFLCKGGSIKLIDFGIARRLDMDSTLTFPGALMGTSLYMSPEAFKSQRQDIRSDLYSLGATLYHALVGQPPFTGDLYVLMCLHTREKPDLSKLPVRMQSIIGRLLAKKPPERYQTASALIKDLEKIGALPLDPLNEFLNAGAEELKRMVMWVLPFRHKVWAYCGSGCGKLWSFQELQQQKALVFEQKPWCWSCLRKRLNRKLAGYRIGQLWQDSFGAAHMALPSWSSHLKCWLRIRQCSPAPVVLRLFPTNRPADMEQWSRMLQRIERGYSQMQQYRYPGLLKVHDFFKSGRRGYITVQEYVPGVLLKSLLRSEPWPSQAAFAFLYQLAGALSALYELNFVNRNLGPSTIMVSLEGKVLIANFALTKFMGWQDQWLKDEDHAVDSFEDLTSYHQHDSQEAGEQDEELTHHGVMLGIPAYMAPEQIKDAASSNHQSDIWSWGVIAYEVLTGKRLFSRKDRTGKKLKMMHILNKVVKFRELPATPRVSHEMRQILIKALQPDPAKRFQTSYEIQEAMEKLSPQKISRRQPRRSY